VPDGIDTSVKLVQTSGIDSPLDRMPAQPESDELPKRHHAVLPFRQIRDLLID
jgi:hypothetical protein